MTSLLEGVAILTARGSSGARQGPYGVAAGTLSIVAGCMIASVLFAFFGGFYVLAASQVLMGIALWTAPASSASIPPAPSFLS